MFLFVSQVDCIGLLYLAGFSFAAVIDFVLADDTVNTDTSLDPFLFKYQQFGQTFNEALAPVLDSEEDVLEDIYITKDPSEDSRFKEENDTLGELEVEPNMLLNEQHNSLDKESLKNVEIDEIVENSTIEIVKDDKNVREGDKIGAQLFKSKEAWVNDTVEIDKAKCEDEPGSQSCTDNVAKGNIYVSKDTAKFLFDIKKKDVVDSENVYMPDEDTVIDKEIGVEHEETGLVEIYSGKFRHSNKEMSKDDVNVIDVKDFVGQLESAESLVKDIDSEVYGFENIVIIDQGLEDTEFGNSQLVLGPNREDDRCVLSYDIKEVKGGREELGNTPAAKCDTCNDKINENIEEKICVVHELENKEKEYSESQDDDKLAVCAVKVNAKDKEDSDKNNANINEQEKVSDNTAEQHEDEDVKREDEPYINDNMKDDEDITDSDLTDDNEEEEEEEGLEDCVSDKSTTLPDKTLNNNNKSYLQFYYEKRMFNPDLQSLNIAALEHIGNNPCFGQRCLLELVKANPDLKKLTMFQQIVTMEYFQVILQPLSPTPLANMFFLLKVVLYHYTPLKLYPFVSFH